MVLTTNHKNPEKDLLMYENIIQTIRLLLFDAYDFDDGEIARTFKDLEKQVPTLCRLHLTYEPVLGRGSDLVY